MEKLFQFPPGGERIEPFEGSDYTKETEQHWPLINAEESRFLENTGGEYEGYTETEGGTKQFLDVRISRIAYYDPDHRTIIEAFVSSEGVNDEGGNELRGPSDIAEFTLMIVRRSRSGQEIGSPDIIPLRAADFPDRPISTNDLRVVAREAHDLITGQVSRLKSSESLQRVKTYLMSRGWRPPES